MKIYVDNDAMPRPLKELLYNVANRHQVKTIFVAATAMSTGAYSEFIESIGAGKSFNGADDWIVDNVEENDLVITADIPLADRAISKGAKVLSLKGDFFTTQNIKNALAMRDLMEELRSTGEITGGPAPFSNKQKEKFTNSLNHYIQKNR